MLSLNQRSFFVQWMMMDSWLLKVLRIMESCMLSITQDICTIPSKVQDDQGRRNEKHVRLGRQGQRLWNTIFGISWAITIMNSQTTSVMACTRPAHAWTCHQSIKGLMGLTSACWTSDYWWILGQKESFSLDVHPLVCPLHSTGHSESPC